MIHSATKCKQTVCKLLSVFMLGRAASSLIHQAASRRGAALAAATQTSRLLLPTAKLVFVVQ